MPWVKGLLENVSFELNNELFVIGTELKHEIVAIVHGLNSSLIKL